MYMRKLLLLIIAMAVYQTISGQHVSHGDRHLGMTAAMTQVSVPTAKESP